MEKLIRRDEASGKWPKRNNPVRVPSLDSLLKKTIDLNYRYDAPYKLRKNIIYSLGYLEFLFRCLQDFSLNVALERQIYKSIVVVGMGIMEGIIRYLLVKRGLHDKIKEKLKDSSVLEKKEVGTQTIIIKQQIYEKLPHPKLTRMKFSDMVKKAERHKILGPSKDLYQEIKDLKPLRDRVHLEARSPGQEPNFNPFTDTDYNAFLARDVKVMAKILYEVFTESIFKPSKNERQYFEYLKNFPQSLTK